MQRKKRSSNNPNKQKKKKYLRSFEESVLDNYNWVVPLAAKIKIHAELLAKFIAGVLAELAKTPFQSKKLLIGRMAVMKGIAKVLFPQFEGHIDTLEYAFKNLKEGFADYSAEILNDPEVTQELLTPMIEVICSTIENNPRLILLFGNGDILQEAFGNVGDKISGFLEFIPALSAHAAEKFPELKETFFHALFQLNKNERDQIYKLAEEILSQVYKEKVFPVLRETLGKDPRGKVLAPILLGAIEAIPGESCINTVLSIACTPRDECTNGRIIAIAIQEMGGLYIKIAQVISELCPPSLAKELRTSQDDAGGLFPSIEKSYEYLLQVLSDPLHVDWKNYLIIPEIPIRHFASASVGALYNLQLNQQGKEKFGLNSILIKIQRPNLKELFEKQCKDILKLTDKAQEAIIADSTLTTESGTELLGLVTTIKKAVINYYKQGREELDFRQEEVNANQVRSALKDTSEVKIPKFYYSSEHVVFMECVTGAKVTKIVQTKYLERKKIADKVASVYLSLIFKHGVVWADPHPGNILYDDEIDIVSMIDLNPCFIWDQKTSSEFKNLIYRLFLRDAYGVYKTLYYLCDNRRALYSNTIVEEISNFLKYTSASASLTRFVGEFLKLLGENEIDLKSEVQAALRGLSQIALTSNLISARNNFGTLIRKEFSINHILTAIFDVGIWRVSKTMIAMFFELTRNIPAFEIGPSLDERDLLEIKIKTLELTKNNVCQIELRRLSPEDYPELKMSPDSQKILVTSVFSVEVIDRIKPAVVKYVISVPTKKWLKERQEFVRLSGIAKNMCLVECFEQLRRSSLDDYWCLIDSWNKDPNLRTPKETYINAHAKIASGKLFYKRFKGIWKVEGCGVSFSSNYAWKILVNFELRRELMRQKYLLSQKNIIFNISLLSFFAAPFFRIIYLLFEVLIFLLNKYFDRKIFSMHLLPISSEELSSRILFNLGRDLNK